MASPAESANMGSPASSASASPRSIAVSAPLHRAVLVNSRSLAMEDARGNSCSLSRCSLDEFVARSQCGTDWMYSEIAYPSGLGGESCSYSGISSAHQSWSRSASGGTNTCDSGDAGSLVLPVDEAWLLEGLASPDDVKPPASSASLMPMSDVASWMSFYDY